MSWSRESEVKRRNARNLLLLSLQHVDHANVAQAVHTIQIA
jgi:hypothetical protein